MPIKALLFDLDGTLLDTIADLADAMNQCLTQHDFPQHDVPFYRQAVGDGARLLVERALPPAERSPQTIEQVYANFQIVYAGCWNKQTRPYEGIRPLLQSLRDRGIRLAVLSNKPDDKTRACVTHFFAPGTFEVVAGKSDRFPLKPDPAAAHWIMQQVGLAPQDCLFIGDTDTDMQTARNAGMVAVGVTWGFRDREELRRNQARFIVDHPSEIVPLLAAGADAPAGLARTS